MADLVNPADYGVLPVGFVRLRLPEVRQLIIDDLQTRLGVTVETRADSVTGQFIDTFAERTAALWELAESVYHAMYPISAFGVNLDHSVSFAGVRRLFAQRANVAVVCYGLEGTIIPAGSLIRNVRSREDFSLREPVTISRQHAIDLRLAVPPVIVVGATYWVQIDGVTYSYTAGVGDDAVMIAAALGAQLSVTPFEHALDGNILRVWTVEGAPFEAQFSANLGVAEFGSPGIADAAGLGPREVRVGGLTQIVSTTPGWTRVDNLVPGLPGRDTETDDELRLRYNRGVYRLGTATLPALQATLEQNVAGLLSVQVFENKQSYTDSEGRSPHSIEVVAYGGDPAEIARQIFLTKAAGIDTFGSVSIQVSDSLGFQHRISFNRPRPLYFWVRAEVRLYNRESFPDNGLRLIAENVAATGNAFGVGRGVITQRFFGPIFGQIPGISYIRITLATTDTADVAPPPGAYTEDNLAVAARQVPQFAVERIVVAITT